MIQESAPLTTELDPERQQKAKEYARIHRRLFLVELVWDGIYALLWLILGWALYLKIALLSLTQNEWLLVAGFALVFGGIQSILSLPLSYYSDFVLPHRYGLSTQTFKDWVIDNIKGIAVAAPIGLILLEVIYLILRAYPDTWWLWAAGIMLIFSVLLTNLAPVLIMPLFNKFVPLGEGHADLEARLLRLAEKANTRVRGVYQFDMSRRTKTANAALTGIGNSRRIILGDTLINEFTPDEIETVLAHELGHQVNHDIPLGILIGTITTLVGFYLAGLGLRWGVDAFGFAGPSDVAAMPLFGITLGIYGLVTMPLSNAFSRWRERRADRYALEITGKGEAYAAALTRLANQNLAEADPDPLVEILLHSHPALNKRISFAQSYHGHE
jgi:STE24 endopeptidase